ncbi:dynamin-like GTPase family protein [Synechocystis sp. PCC 7509]|uniref:dynamin-like GTPase family protein n=1 Tax=Synechocystis sp. PCC 7509 TaxID=927677 RepID=UPI0002AC8C05|nr:dynamin-like GTPase family protein [Synechocystis sp. PCC 7509]
MTEPLTQCQNLQAQVESILQLSHQEASLRSQDITPVQSSLRKAVSPTFEIVFAGAFSAGKSMLINALLERELLYSAEGHATGTECYIFYAEAEQEKVILTFLSEVEIREQAVALCQKLGLTAPSNINDTEMVNLLRQGCVLIIQKEGGESKSERAKQAKALILLLEGFETNRDRIHSLNNATYSMEQFNFANLKEAASFARRGSNSAVLKRIEYYCTHPLLKDGNVIIDTPGIDAPVQKDAELAYRKIEHPDTSAVVCVLKPASAGDMTKEETELIEKTNSNIGIRDRLFYVFNRIDETWFKPELKQRLDRLINSEFQNTTRVYKTSGLLGFHGSQVKQHTNKSDRFGLDSIFAESVGGLEGQEETPQFVNALMQYCALSGKLPPTFRIDVRGYETPNQNYERILNDYGMPLIDQLIIDSGIEEFRSAITRYLTEEKRPQLFSNLADDLQPVCINLRNNYLAKHRELDSQPREIEAMKARELELLSKELQDLGEHFFEHIELEVNQLVNNKCENFEKDFLLLQTRMIGKLDELLNTFSVADAYSRATLSHRRNATAPLIAILVEALYYLSNELEDVLVKSCQEVINSFFQRLIERVQKAEYYSHLYRLLGNDAGIVEQIKALETLVQHSLMDAAKVECDRFVRESPRFYDEGTFSIYQFRQTLAQTSQGYDSESMVQAQPAIRQLLKLDFEPKVSETIRKNFRANINAVLKNGLLPLAEKQANQILQQYNNARNHLEQTLEKEAEEKIAGNMRSQKEVESNISAYNQAVSGINGCLQAMQLHTHLLPLIADSDFKSVIVDTEVVSLSHFKVLAI